MEYALSAGNLTGRSDVVELVCSDVFAEQCRALNAETALCFFSAEPADRPAAERAVL